MRVVYLDHCAQLSGAEIALLRLLAHLPAEIEPVVVLAEDGPLVAQVRELGVQVLVLPVPATGDVRRERVRLLTLGLPALWAWARYTWQLTRTLRGLRVDVVHTNSLKAALYGGVAARISRIPVLWHVHDIWSEAYLPDDALRLLGLAGRVLPSRLVANSVASERAFAALVPPRTARRLAPTVIHNVLPEQAFARPKQSYGPIDRVVMVGRLAPWKGQDVFLRAFAKVADPEQRMRAVIAGEALFGEDDFAAGLRRLAEELGIGDRTEFLGFVDDVPTLLRGADLLVHASVTAEPFGQVIVEGMAAGLPVIASDEGGPREIIEDGVDGLLVRPGDVDALTRAIEQVRADPALVARLGGGATTSALRYAAPAQVSALVALYETMRRAR